MPSSKRRRADTLLVEQGLVESRTKAQALILAGSVYLREERVDKAGQQLPIDAPLSVRQSERYVSRGGYKLESALDDAQLLPADLVCADIGASTGGFTDCLLQRGAKRIYAIDVGRGLLAHKLVCDARVVVMDKTNARYLSASDFDHPLDLAVIDASFIGIGKLMPATAAILPEGGLLLAMIKPQFEVGRQQASKSKGVIKDPEVRKTAIDAALREVQASGFEIISSCDSRLPGPKGNVEHFVYARRTGAAPPPLPAPPDARIA